MKKENAINEFYDELDEYLQWEGIIGYIGAIIDILLLGKDSIYYIVMKQEKGDYDNE